VTVRAPGASLASPLFLCDSDLGGNLVVFKAQRVPAVRTLLAAQQTYAFFEIVAFHAQSHRDFLGSDTYV